MLQSKGLAMGEYPELAALEHPDWLLDIHRAYAAAGSQILCANTFGANREKLRRTGRTVCLLYTSQSLSSKSTALHPPDGRDAAGNLPGPAGK